MATYTVKRNQNLFDIAIELYGSIEGLYDLMISNPEISMDMDLTAGMELEYHDYFVINESIVNEIKTQGYNPINGERHVYLKHPGLQEIFQIVVPAKVESSDFVISGDGIMYVDWGDNSDIEAISLSHTVKTISHYFDSVVEKRVIRVYGSFSILSWYATHINGQIYVLYPVTVDEFTYKANEYSLEGLFLFNGTVDVDLTGMHISDLSPIYGMSLQTLDLRNVIFDNGVLDAYLQNIVSHYGTRRNCTVYLSTEPGSAGMAAIQTIINEASWNSSGAWVFNINGTIYTTVS